MGNPVKYPKVKTAPNGDYAVDMMNMEWSGRQLAKISGTGLSTSVYKYNQDGLRSYKKVGSEAATEFYYSGSKLMYEKRANVEMFYSYDSAGRLSGIRHSVNGGPLYATYPVLNSRGDVIALYSGSGSFVARYKYDAWGNIISITDANGNTPASATHIANMNPFRYRGYYYDTETGFYYLGSRYYDPEIGRFISPDTADVLDNDFHHILENNLYAYCFNNPVNMVDDDGTFPRWAKITIGVAAIGIGVAATVASGGAAAPVLIASIKIAAVSTAIGAGTSAAIGAASHRVSTGSWDGAGKVALSSAVDGAADGFMWGGISAGATFATVAAKGIQVQQIGKLQSQKGKGYKGVKYDVKKPNGKYTTKSFELHSPHASGPHQQWHWQQNTWHNNGIPNGPKNFLNPGQPWSIFGRRI